VWVEYTRTSFFTKSTVYCKPLKLPLYLTLFMACIGLQRLQLKTTNYLLKFNFTKAPPLHVSGHDVHHQDVSSRIQALWYNIMSKCMKYCGEPSVYYLLMKAFIPIRNLIFLKISEIDAAVQPLLTSCSLVLTHYLKHFGFSGGSFFV